MELDVVTGRVALEAARIRIQREAAAHGARPLKATLVECVEPARETRPPEHVAALEPAERAVRVPAPADRALDVGHHRVAPAERRPLVFRGLVLCL